MTTSIIIAILWAEEFRNKSKKKCLGDYRLPLINKFPRLNFPNQIQNLPWFYHLCIWECTLSNKSVAFQIPFICSTSTIETLEKVRKYVQS